MKRIITPAERDPLYADVRALLAKWRISPNHLHKIAEVAVKEGS